MKASKTWKIGEYARGGIITVEINGPIIYVIGKEWDTKKGFKKNSDQSNAKEFIRGTFNINDSKVDRYLDEFISNLTTSYYTGIIIEWIQKINGKR